MCPSPQNFAATNSEINPGFIIFLDNICMVVSRLVLLCMLLLGVANRHSHGRRNKSKSGNWYWTNWGRFCSGITSFHFLKTTKLKCNLPYCRDKMKNVRQCRLICAHFMGNLPLAVYLIIMLQGYGLFTLEEQRYSPDGFLYTRGPGMYKIPGFTDIPVEFNVSILKGASNPQAVYSSKVILSLWIAGLQSSSILRPQIC